MQTELTASGKIVSHWASVTFSVCHHIGPVEALTDSRKTAGRG